MAAQLCTPKYVYITVCEDMKMKISRYQIHPHLKDNFKHLRVEYTVVVVFLTLTCINIIKKLYVIPSTSK